MPEEFNKPTESVEQSPHHATKLHPLVEFFWRELRLLKSPSFYVAVVVVGMAIFWMGERHYSGMINSKDSLIASISQERDRANRDYDKLSKQYDSMKTYRGKDALPIKRTALILASQINELLKDCKDSDTADKQYKTVQRFTDRFVPRVAVVRDDLDQNGKHSDELDKAMREYYQQYNYKTVRIIASEIESLANGLPD